MESRGEYLTIFTLPPIETILTSVFQTFIFFCLIFAGLRLIGRKIFSERCPQDFVTILLVAEASNLGLTDERAGFWGCFFSVITLFIIAYLVDRIKIFRDFLHEKPLLLYSRGRLHRRTMEKNMIDEDDLDELARERGFSSYKSFDSILLEGDGRISAIEPSKNF